MAKKNDNAPKILHICAKCSDNCYALLEDSKGNPLREQNSYVPKMMPGEFIGEEPEGHFGDYVILSIDIETGKILNWKKPSKAVLDTFIKTGK